MNHYRNDLWTPAQEQRLLEICQHTHRVGEIARALEPVREGVTRNSIIGKIARLRRAGHRIATGPPGGGYPEQAKRRKVRNTEQSFARVEVERMSKKSGETGSWGKLGETGGNSPELKIVGNRPQRVVVARGPDGLRLEPAIPMRRLTLLQLGHGMCKWPIGDPSRPGFHFCGNDTCHPERPYCAPHHAFAHHG